MRFVLRRGLYYVFRVTSVFHVLRVMCYVFCLQCFTCFVLFFRGKGDYFRLGHGSDSHVRKPQIVEGLKGKQVVDVAVGALHCLAVTEQGQVRQSVPKMLFVRLI